MTEMSYQQFFVVTKHYMYTIRIKMKTHKMIVSFHYLHQQNWLHSLALGFPIVNTNLLGKHSAKVHIVTLVK